MNVLNKFQRVVLILSIIIFFLIQLRIETDWIIILARSIGIYAVSALIMYVSNRFVEDRYLVARHTFGLIGIVIGFILMVRF